MARVLIATDGSDFAIAAARTALDLLSPGVEVTVLTVAPLALGPPSVVVEPGGVGLGGGAPGLGGLPDPVTTEELERSLLEESRAALERTVEALDIDAERRLERGDPGAEICRLAEDEAFDLVVVGSHGSGLMKRVLVGSVSHHVVHHAPCPVLVMRGRA